MSITEEISPVNQFNAFLHDWWTPSMAVAFLAFGRNPQSLHFDPDTPTHEHVSIGRMLSFGQRRAEALLAVQRLERELKRGRIAARIRPDGAVIAVGRGAKRGRPAAPHILPEAWGPWGAPRGQRVGLAPHLDDLDIDALMKDGRDYSSWEISNRDLLCLPLDEDNAGIPIGLALKQLPAAQLRVAIALHFLDLAGAVPPLRMEGRFKVIRDTVRGWFHGEVGKETIRTAMKKLAAAGWDSPWVRFAVS